MAYGPLCQCAFMSYGPRIQQKAPMIKVNRVLWDKLPDFEVPPGCEAPPPGAFTLYTLDIAEKKENPEQPDRSLELDSKIGCCHYDHDECFSRVGTNRCFAQASAEVTSLGATTSAAEPLRENPRDEHVHNDLPPSYIQTHAAQVDSANMLAAGAAGGPKVESMQVAGESALRPDAAPVTDDDSSAFDDLVPEFVPARSPSSVMASMPDNLAFHHIVATARPPGQRTIEDGLAFGDSTALGRRHAKNSLQDPAAQSHSPDGAGLEEDGLAFEDVALKLVPERRSLAKALPEDGLAFEDIASNLRSKR